MPSLGVKVALQLMPPSLLVSVDSVPPPSETFALDRPVTASAKLSVSVAVSPAFRSVSLMARVGVGARVSIVKLPEVLLPMPVWPPRPSRRCCRA